MKYYKVRDKMTSHVLHWKYNFIYFHVDARGNACRKRIQLYLEDVKYYHNCNQYSCIK
jgi:hypothetical protein